MNSNIDIIHKAVLVRSSLCVSDRNHSYFHFYLKIMNDRCGCISTVELLRKSTHETRRLTSLACFVEKKMRYFFLLAVFLGFFPAALFIFFDALALPLNSRHRFNQNSKSFFDLMASCTT